MRHWIGSRQEKDGSWATSLYAKLQRQEDATGSPSPMIKGLKKQKWTILLQYICPHMLSFSLDSEKDTHVNLKHICLWTFSTGEQTSSPSKLTSGETNGYPKEHQILLAWTAQAASRLVYFPIPQNHPRGNIIRERSGYRGCVTTTWKWFLWDKRHHAIWGENLSPLTVLLTVPISWPTCRSQEAALRHKTFSTE